MNRTQASQLQTQTVKAGQDGQFVLPSSIRERLSLREGAELDVHLEDEEGGCVMSCKRHRGEAQKDADQDQDVVERNGRLLLTGTLADHPAQAVRHARNERLDKIAKL